MPIRGLDTSSTDINAPDGAMQELHNLRYSGEAWRNVKPFKVVERFRITTKAANLIECGRDAGTDEFYITSRFPVASDIVITAYWYDVDGEYTSTTTATLHVGEQSVAIDEAQESFGWIEIDVKEDDYFLYYTPKDSAPIIPSSEDEIIYQHPADEEDVYIARRVQADGTITLLRASIKYGTYVILGVIAEGLPSNITLSHFGKILIINAPANLQIIHLALINNEYQEFTTPRAPRIQQSTALSTTGTTGGVKCTKIIPADYIAENHFTVPLYSIEDDSFMIPQFEANGFWGEICYFAVFQMVDGSLISPGALNISASELLTNLGGLSYLRSATQYTTTINHTSDETIAQMMVPDLITRWDVEQVDVFSDSLSIYTDNYNNGAGAKHPMIIPWAFFISPHISISIPTKINTDLIRSVQIYSTRVNPIWDGAKLKAAHEQRRKSITTGITYTVLPRTEATACYADNNLPEQPFYLMKDIPLKEFKNGKYEMYITSELLNGIENKKAYNALDAHQTYASNSMEYNNRIHGSGVLTTKLFDGYGMDFFTDEAEENSETVVEVVRDFQSFFVKAPSAGIFMNPIPAKILSYPDHNATYMYNKTGIPETTNRYSLKSAQANNFAYAINDKGAGSQDNFGYSEGVATRYRFVKYDAYFNDIRIASDIDAEAIKTNDIIKTNNVIRVSAANNPFVWPLANSYTIGTEDNEIIAVNAAALEMSDAKFGEFPLYVFTKEGIFAMQSGSGEVLYSAIVPLNYDRIINPHTLAVNYNVLYITSRGVHALHSNESALISEPINDEANRPLLDFLTNAKMAYQHKFGEVIFYNNDRANGVFKYPNAYTFSLGAKVWATRDWNAEGDLYTRELLNSGVMIQQGDGFAILSDIHEEESTGTTKCYFLSRPMKFNNQEFKRIETLVARLQADPAIEVNVQLQASNDLVTWVTCREVARDTQYDVNIRRTPFSARYFRVSLECTTNGDVSIMGFDFEYYMRFLHRMR